MMGRAGDNCWGRMGRKNAKITADTIYGVKTTKLHPEERYIQGFFKSTGANNKINDG